MLHRKPLQVLSRAFALQVYKPLKFLSSGSFQQVSILAYDRLMLHTAQKNVKLHWTLCGASST